MRPPHRPVVQPARVIFLVFVGLARAPVAMADEQRLGVAEGLVAEDGHGRPRQFQHSYPGCAPYTARSTSFGNGFLPSKQRRGRTKSTWARSSTNSANQLDPTLAGTSNKMNPPVLRRDVPAHFRAHGAIFPNGGLIQRFPQHGGHSFTNELSASVKYCSDFAFSADAARSNDSEPNRATTASINGCGVE